jgi:hypothetical protein
MEQENKTVTPDNIKPDDKTWPEPEFMKMQIPDHIDTSQMTQKKIRKLKKTLFWESKIPEMRAKHRKNIKLKKQKKKEDIEEKVAKGETVDEKAYPEYATGRGKNFKVKFREELQLHHPIVIDCAFENLHRMKDIRSLGNQFSQLLGVNRKLADEGRLPKNAAEIGVEAKAFNIYLTSIVPNAERKEFPLLMPDLSKTRLNSKEMRRLKNKGLIEKYELPEDKVIRIGEDTPWQETNFGAKGKLSNYLKKRDADGWMMNIVENEFTDLPFIEGSSCENRTAEDSL